MMRTDPKAAFERLPLVAAADPAAFEGMLFHLEKSTEYYVESNGVDSPIFSLTVVDLPTVSTSWISNTASRPTPVCAAQAVKAAATSRRIRGTEVLLHITPTMATPSGRILLNDGASQPLTTQADGTLTGSFKIDRAGVLQDRADGSARREGGRVAAVHDRRHRRSAAGGALQQAGTRHAGEPGRRAVRSRRAPTTTSASSSCSCSTRSTAAPEKTVHAVRRREAADRK